MARHTPLLLLLLLAAGCEAEPFARPGTWRATGANDDNLRAMVADPADLGPRPTPAPRAAGAPAAEAAARLRRGEARSLPEGGLGRPAPTLAPGGGGHGQQ